MSRRLKLIKEEYSFFFLHLFYTFLFLCIFAKAPKKNLQRVSLLTENRHREEGTSDKNQDHS